MMPEKSKTSAPESASKGEAPDFEANLKRLEEIVANLESGDLTLEESLKAYESGMALSRECQKALDSAQQRVEIVREKDGQFSSEPFDEDSEN